MKRNFFKKDIQNALILLVFIFLLATPFKFARAEDSPSGLQVSPVRFDWDINAGEERTGVINLKNYDNSSRSVTIEIEDFYVTDETTQAKFFVPTSDHPLIAYDVINWIEVPQVIELAPKEGKDIMFKVTVPENTPTGGYYGAIFFNTKMDDGGGQGSRIFINQRIGALLVMAVKGTQPIIRTGEIKNFGTFKKIYWSNPVKLFIDMFNSGNLHYKMLGTVDIYKFGKKIDTISLMPRIIYPGKVRKYDESWEFSPWAFGYYTAKVHLFSEDGSIDLSYEISFWVIPWKTVFSIIILLTIIWLIFKLFSSRFEIKRKGE